MGFSPQFPPLQRCAEAPISPKPLALVTVPLFEPLLPRYLSSPPARQVMGGQTEAQDGLTLMLMSTSCLAYCQDSLCCSNVSLIWGQPSPERTANRAHHLPRSKLSLLARGHTQQTVVAARRTRSRPPCNSPSIPHHHRAQLNIVKPARRPPPACVSQHGADK